MADMKSYYDPHKRLVGLETHKFPSAISQDDTDFCAERHPS